jgi:hypothetical protein
MDASLLEVVPEDHPERCQQVTGTGQCRNKAKEGTNRCPIHDRHSERLVKKEKLHAYQLGVWQARLEEFLEGPDLKSLAGEIGILRMMLENILKQIDTPTKFLIHNNIINDTVGRIERVVGTFDRIEEKSGRMLDKSAILRLVGTIVDIISKHVSDPLTAGRIADEICNAVLTTSCETPDDDGI